MSLLPFTDPFDSMFNNTRRPRYRRTGDWGPLIPLSIMLPFHSSVEHPSSGLGSYLTAEFHKMQELESQMIDVQMNNEDGQMRFSCNVAGYLPEELNVDVEGNDLVISGEHKQQGGGQSVHRTFMRRLTLPEGVHKESIMCNIDEKGCLCVKAQRPTLDQPARISIPIGFKQSAGTELTGGDQMEKKGIAGKSCPKKGA